MMVKKFLNKTQVALFLLLTAISAITITIIAIPISYIYNKEFYEYKERYFIEQTYHISYILRTNLVTPLSSPKNKELFEKITKEFSTPIEFYDNDFNFLLYENNIDYTHFKEPFFVDVPIVSEGKVQGYLRAHYDFEKRNSAPILTKFERKLQTQQRITMLSAFLIMMVISYILSRKLSLPIKQSASSAQKIIGGNRREFVPRNGTVEIKQLIDGINTMVDEFHKVESWRKRMMEDLTHELRTPITSVLTRMEAIIDGVYPLTTENLQDIYDEMERLSRLVINVEKLSEAEGARFHLNIKKVNINDLVKSVYEGFLFIARKKNIQFEFIGANKPCSAFVDPDKMIQIVTNIISNALKYTPNGGNVQVGVDIEDDEVIFYCKDNGVGIPKEDLPLIFNRFYRTDKSRSREYGGSGIGLSITRALVHAHRGKIQVKSKLGVGSIFKVIIPVNQHLLSENDVEEIAEGTHDIF